MKIDKDIKNLIIGLGIGFGMILFYFIANITQGIILLPLKEVGFEKWALNSLSIIYSILMILTLIYMSKKLWMKSWKDLKKNHRKLFKKYFKFWFLTLALMMVANLTIGLISGDIAKNESVVREMFSSSPIYIYISAVFIAPIAEELVFRASFYHMTENKYLFIALSGLSFGAIHVLPSWETWIDLLYIIPYSIPGFVFAYTLYKSKNIFVPISLHFVHNGVLMALQALVMIFS